MQKIDNETFDPLKKERKELEGYLDIKMYDPASEEYGKVRSHFDWADRRLESWYKLQKEQEQINAEYRKCDSDEKVAKFQLIGSIGAAVVTTLGAIVSNVMKYKMGSEAMQASTREAFGMDQDKVQSRVAADQGKKMFDFFFTK